MLSPQSQNDQSQEPGLYLEYALASLMFLALSLLWKGQTDVRAKPCHAAEEGDSPAGSCCKLKELLTPGCHCKVHSLLVLWFP